MTKDENSLVVIAWSKLYIASLLIASFDHPGFQEAINFHIDAARNLLEQIMNDNRPEVFEEGGGI